MPTVCRAGAMMFHCAQNALAVGALTATVAALAAFATTAGSIAEASPLHDAVRTGDVEALRRLAGDDADVNAVDENGLTPLLQSIFSGHDAATEALIAAGADVNQMTKVKGSVLRALGADIEPDQDPRATPLFVAAFVGNRAAVERLLRAAADVHAAVDEGLKPLHLAASNRDPEIARLLLDGGARVNDRDAHAATPLHTAARRGNAAVVSLLLARGADVNAIDEEGRTPLDIASTEEQPEIAAILVGHGARAMQEMSGARIDVAGSNPRLAPPLRRSTLEHVAPWGSRPLGLALDVARRKLFWTELAGGRIGTSDLDGSNPEYLSTPDLSGPIGLALDAAGSSLYWSCDATYPRKLQRARADGSDLVDLASGRSVNRPSAVAVDATSGDVFWTESVAGRIRRADADGSGVEDIVTSGISSQGDRADAREFKALGIAVDRASRKIYWTEMLDAEILRADLDGSNVERIVAASSGLDLPAGIAVDRGRIYWADAGAAKIRRAGADGSAVEDVLTADDGLIEPYALALDPEAGRIYWTDASAGTISSATLAGDDVRTVLATGAQPSRAQSATDECARAATAAGRRYVWKAVNAVGTCLRKVDALKAVWRSQSDGARATASCQRQLDRLAGGAQAVATLEGELRAVLEQACGADLGGLIGASDAPLPALLEGRCDSRDDRSRALDCVVAGFTDAAYSQVALRFARAAEWLEEVRPFIASAGTTPSRRNALANLDRWHAALRAMTAKTPPRARPVP